jgi:hypothetical protein
MRVLVIDQSRPLIRSARLQQFGIPGRPEDERLEARHHIDAEQPAGERVHGHEHFPIDQPGLRLVSKSILVIVLSVCRTVQHQGPIAEREESAAHGRRIGKP